MSVTNQKTFSYANYSLISIKCTKPSPFPLDAQLTYVCPFHQPHYLLVNLALGGDNGGDVTKMAFPAYMYVDFVRVYQKKK